MEDNIKTKIIDKILFDMNQYLDSTTSDILQSVLEKEFLYVNIEEMNTLPSVETQTAVDSQNRYYIELMKIKKKNICEGTKKDYIDAVTRLVTYIDKPLDKIDEVDIEAYLRYYEQRYDERKKCRPNAITCNNERSYLSAFFCWMRKEKFISYNPVENVEPKKEIKQPVDYFYPQQLEQLREGCKNLRDAALLEVLRSTGARVGEIVGINRQDVNWETGDILILSEKSDKYRTIYLDEVARYHLRKYMYSRNDNCEALFVGLIEPHERLSINGVENALKKIATRGGVKGRVYPHKMRKTLGMNLKKSGVDIGYIQEILGHSNPDTTARYYAESTPETLRDIRKKVGT